MSHEITTGSGAVPHEPFKEPLEQKKAQEVTVGGMVQSVRSSSSKDVVKVPIKKNVPETKGIETTQIVHGVKEELAAKSATKVHHVRSDIVPLVQLVYESGVRSLHSVSNDFKEQIDQSALPPERKEELKQKMDARLGREVDKLIGKCGDKLAHPLLSENLTARAVGNKEEIESYKKLSKEVQQEVYESVAGFADSLLEVTSDDEKKLFSDFVQKTKDNASNLEGVKRFEIIHEHPMWDPDKVTNRYMSFTDSKTEEMVLSVSSFHAEGPSYSSQAPRNRSSEDACPANFFSTSMSFKEPGEEDPEEAVHLTRSAVTVEFDQKDPVERKEANHTLVKHVLDHQTKEMLQEHTFEELENAQDPKNPLVLTSDTINLLTTDKLRTWAKDYPMFQQMGSKVHHSLTGTPAEDERSLALENLEAHTFWNGKVVPFTVQDPEGKEMVVYVKFDIRYFNIPNNVMQESTPEFLTYSKSIDESNKKSWDKLDLDAREQINNMNEELTTDLQALGENLSEGDKQWFQELFSLQHDKMHFREEAQELTIKQKTLNASSVEIENWAKTANTLADMMREKLNDPNTSDEVKTFLKKLEERELYIDLFLDTSELFLSGLSKDTKNMDNNRSALASRLILLNALTNGHKTHFGCRSGKDRTGLVDIEVKLLLTEAKLRHRIPSYREQERIHDTVDHRETMTMESGNVFDLVEAVMGAKIGLNSGGSASEAFNMNAARVEQHNEFTESAQAFSKAASRPPAKGGVGPGFLEKHDTRIIVQHEG